MVRPLLKLSTYATALGMALVILSITSGKGLQHAINDQFRSLEGDININEYSMKRTGESGAILLSDSLQGYFIRRIDKTHARRNPKGLAACESIRRCFRGN